LQNISFCHFLFAAIVISYSLNIDNIETSCETTKDVILKFEAAAIYRDYKTALVNVQIDFIKRGQINFFISFLVSRAKTK